VPEMATTALSEPKQLHPGQASVRDRDLLVLISLRPPDQRTCRASIKTSSRSADCGPPADRSLGRPHWMRAADLCAVVDRYKTRCLPGRCARIPDQAVVLSETEDQELPVFQADRTGDLVVDGDDLQAVAVALRGTGEQSIDITDTSEVEPFLSSVGRDAVENQQAGHRKFAVDRDGVVCQGVCDVDQCLEALA